MRLPALLALLMLLAGPAVAQRQCDQYRASITAVSVVTPTEQVPGVAAQRIYLCGYVIMPDSAAAGQSVEFEITSGTGVNCATNKAVMIPRMRVPPNGIVNRNPYVTGETAGPGAAVCLQTWGTGSITSIFYWAQF